MAMSNNQMVIVLSLWNLWFCWKKTTPMPNLPVMSMGDGIGLSELACFSIWKSKRLWLGPEDLKIFVLFLYYLRIFIFINPKQDQGFIPTVWCHTMFGSSCTMLDSFFSWTLLAKNSAWWLVEKNPLWKIYRSPGTLITLIYILQ